MTKSEHRVERYIQQALDKWPELFGGMSPEDHPDALLKLVELYQRESLAHPGKIPMIQDDSNDPHRSHRASVRLWLVNMREAGRYEERAIWKLIDLRGDYLYFANSRSHFTATAERFKEILVENYGFGELDGKLEFPTEETLSRLIN